MEIILLVGDMRYESFLDKSKHDIASSSGLVLGSFSRSTFLQGDPFVGIFRTLDLLSPLLITLMVPSPLPEHMLVLSLHTLQGESCLWQRGAAHSGEFGLEGNDEAILSWSFYGLANNKVPYIRSCPICLLVFPSYEVSFDSCRGSRVKKPNSSSKRPWYGVASPLSKQMLVLSLHTPQGDGKEVQLILVNLDVTTILSSWG
ncbi:unnamed protein product [Prunus brigantina]